MPTALIVGAGIGGLAAAVALRRAGWGLLAIRGDAGPEALRRYERVRARRTRSVVQLARRNARMGSIKSAAACWIRDQVIGLIPESVILKSLVALGRPPWP